MVAVAQAVVDNTSPGAANYVTWYDLLLVADIFCCCLLFLPIVWSIRHLREGGADREGSGAKLRSNLVRLTNFRRFYVGVVAYVYLTRLVAHLLASSLPFELTWIAAIVAEVGRAGQGRHTHTGSRARILQAGVFCWRAQRTQAHGRQTRTAKRRTWELVNAK